jgi:hypothetical protein
MRTIPSIECPANNKADRVRSIENRVLGFTDFGHDSESCHLTQLQSRFRKPS